MALLEVLVFVPAGLVLADFLIVLEPCFREGKLRWGGGRIYVTILSIPPIPVRR